MKPMSNELYQTIRTHLNHLYDRAHTYRHTNPARRERLELAAERLEQFALVNGPAWLQADIKCSSLDSLVWEMGQTGADPAKRARYAAAAERLCAYSVAHQPANRWN